MQLFRISRILSVSESTLAEQSGNSVTQPSPRPREIVRVEGVGGLGGVYPKLKSTEHKKCHKEGITYDHGQTVIKFLNTDST